MYLVDQFGILERDDLFKSRLVRNILTMSNRLGFIRIVLETTDDVHDEIITEQDVKKRGLIEIEEKSKDLVQVVKTVFIL